MADQPLSRYPELSSAERDELLSSLEAAAPSDPIANVKLLFCRALRAANPPSLSPEGGMSSSQNGDGEANLGETPDDVATYHLEALGLLRQAFRTMRDKRNTVLPEEVLEDWVFVRAVYVRLQRAQAALSIRAAQDVESDLRHYAATHETTLPPAQFSTLLGAAHAAVPSAGAADAVLTSWRRERERAKSASRSRSRARQPRAPRTDQLVTTADYPDIPAVPERDEADDAGIW